MVTNSQISPDEVRKIVHEIIVNDYFKTELEEARNSSSNLDPQKVVLFKAGLVDQGEKQSDQQKAVLNIHNIVVEQLSASKNITEGEVRSISKMALDWAAKNSKQVNETFNKTKSIMDGITKVHTNELRAAVSQQIQKARVEEKKKLTS